MAYKADLKLREQIKNECQKEFESLNSKKVEEEMVAKFEIEKRQLQSNFEDKLAKQEEETALLKKTLLE